MAWRSAGSLSRSLVSAARTPALRPSPPLPRLRRPSSFSTSSHRPSFAPSRNLGELGCVQSLLPLHNMVAKAHLTSRISDNLRAFCELSHGT